MTHSTRPVFRRASAVVGSVLLVLSCTSGFAGVQATADKEIAQQQMTTDEAFPLHFSLSSGGESEFVFRGVDILPEVDIDVRKAVTEAVNAVPGFRTFLIEHNTTPKAFVAGIAGYPAKPVEVSRENGLYYVDGNISASFFGVGMQLGAFYGTQSEARVDHNFFGTRPIFDSYHEFDSYVNFSRAFGPVRVSLGGTFYHVINNSNFDTAELNFGVTYTPPQFRYISASFSYNYASAFDFSAYRQGTVHGEYLDGHYLEARLDGEVPLYKHIVTFNPYLLVSAGSGILPRAFNPASLPTFFNTERYSKGSEAFVGAVFKSVTTGVAVPPQVNAAATQAAFDPSTLDRSFDLSNFQAGFRVPFYLTRYITIRGDFNYSRPLGNLDREPYNQKDQIWGGGTVTFAF